MEDTEQSSSMPTDDILDERTKDSWPPTDFGTKPPDQDDASDE